MFHFDFNDHKRNQNIYFAVFMTEVICNVICVFFSKKSFPWTSLTKPTIVILKSLSTDLKHNVDV